jgi:ubiquinone/menaquinone biosynthesis C-methylase UbiE
MMPGMQPDSTSKLHSAEHFGPQRDFWWNRDFLDLMAKRWRLNEASSLADIGCGLCHWSRLLYPHLKQPARLAAVDREPRWVSEAERLFRQAFPSAATELLELKQGDATNIPLPSNQFDVATCQTVLMHLTAPMQGVREMMRIVRPGGLVICVEPNNFWNYMGFTSLTATEPTEVLVRRFEFWLRYHRGKIADGAGDHSIGDLLPGYFAQAGLAEIEVYLSDRAHALFPPYDSPGQRANLEQDEVWRKSETGPWQREELRRRVLAGGGTEDLFEGVFGELITKFNREQEAVAAATFHTGGGGVAYIVSGRKR